MQAIHRVYRGSMEHIAGAQRDVQATCIRAWVLALRSSLPNLLSTLDALGFNAVTLQVPCAAPDAVALWRLRGRWAGHADCAPQVLVALAAALGLPCAPSDVPHVRLQEELVLEPPHPPCPPRSLARDGDGEGEGEGTRMPPPPPLPPRPPPSPTPQQAAVERLSAAVRGLAGDDFAPLLTVEVQETWRFAPRSGHRECGLALLLRWPCLDGAGEAPVVVRTDDDGLQPAPLGDRVPLSDVADRPWAWHAMSPSARRAHAGPAHAARVEAADARVGAATAAVSAALDALDDAVFAAWAGAVERVLGGMLTAHERAQLALDDALTEGLVDAAAGDEDDEWPLTRRLEHLCLLRTPSRHGMLAAAARGHLAPLLLLRAPAASGGGADEASMAARVDDDGGPTWYAVVRCLADRAGVAINRDTVWCERVDVTYAFTSLFVGAPEDAVHDARIMADYEAALATATAAGGAGGASA